MFSCDDEGESESTDSFNAEIILLNNMEPVLNADVFIIYKCISAYGEGMCADIILRSIQNIGYNIPVLGDMPYTLVEINQYDLENNLISNLVNEYKSPGHYTVSHEGIDNVGLFGITFTNIVMKVNGDSLSSYSLMNTTPDFNSVSSIGNTDESGKFTLSSNYMNSLNFPTFYNPPDYEGADGFGNFTGIRSINDDIDGFKILFLYNDTYKSFDFDLINGNYTYTFNWEDGDDFTPSMNYEDNVLNRGGDGDNDTLSLLIYPNPYN